ncbi:GntR family transcriptional regulator [Trichothermofontia sichuanensis B231]|uniref:GntR family transcriptional regulator n=1 Tax=Trichothermofontia sichuanensis TaxID=3045816 RepID=UPI0022463F80|nr:GntR family transcriptional regulator [Trichothermofontia sichuanensis]UZQ54892.1 GntR family transcriptional regulator [Trichothermofontia sichuanensis B231]
MVRFHIQPDSEIPASTQLYNQIRFAIASRQFPPGHRLPSTRQLAMQTGLHRNTISRVYRQLEEDGVVESQAGSGIYVRAQGDEGGTRPSQSVLSQKYPDAHALVKQTLDQLLKQGCSLTESRELFLAEVDWRLRCSARVLVTAPAYDIGAGELITQELEQALQIPVQLVPLEELGPVLAQTRSATVVTTRYFISEAEALAGPNAVRVIPVDIYDYAQEAQLVLELPNNACLGLVSLSPGILRAAEVIIHSLRGDDLLVITAQVNDPYRLNAVVRRAQTIICDREATATQVRAAIQASRDELIRSPQIVVAQSYVGSHSISLLKRELGLT